MIIFVTMQGYSLKVYDCFRPQRAVDDFVAWSNNHYDVLTKREFYPTLNKPDVSVEVLHF